VSITLPDDQTTTGVVTSIGTTASSSSSDSSSGSSGSSGSGSRSGSSSAPSATVNVYIRLDHPAAAGTLDQAPITVAITTSTVNDVLAVPVDALLAEPSGYGVEVAGPDGTRHIVPVSPGLFDDAQGLVQVTGNGLTAGQQVVVPNL
jgi:multidrug efflux pump subunit AcrA (membrane-fusion protein)